MEGLLSFFGILVIIFQIPGQIYLVSFVIKKSRQTNVFLKVIIGIFSFLFINIPGLTVSVLLGQPVLPNQTTLYTPPVLFLSIILVGWAFGISCFGLVHFIRDYWLLYKRKK